ncbi:hypothetical protein KAU04_00340, partial [bacterium]|nr:hypothetical protein [bacterium]
MALAMSTFAALSPSPGYFTLRCKWNLARSFAICNKQLDRTGFLKYFKLPADNLRLYHTIET